MSDIETPEDEGASADADAEARQWPFTLKLKHPVDFGSERITELVFRRGRAGDMKNIVLRDDLPANDLTLIASRLCGKPTKVIDLLDMDDVGEVNDIAMDFYLKYLAVGRKRSR